MKKLLSVVVLCLVTTGLLGCSNVQREDVGLVAGGVAGGLIGNELGGTGGAIGGAVGGAYLGRELAK